MISANPRAVRPAGWLDRPGQPGDRGRPPREAGRPAPVVAQPDAQPDRLPRADRHAVRARTGSPRPRPRPRDVRQVPRRADDPQPGPPRPTSRPRQASSTRRSPRSASPPARPQRHRGAPDARHPPTRPASSTRRSRRSASSLKVDPNNPDLIAARELAAAGRQERRGDRALQGPDREEPEQRRRDPAGPVDPLDDLHEHRRLRQGGGRARDPLRQDPDDATVNNDLGYLYADQGKNLEKAEGMIRKALAEEPDN